MFLCARKQCRNRCLPGDDAFDIKDYPDHFNIHYILYCGHTLCEHCLYMTVQTGERSYQCDQCGELTNLSARAFASIKSSHLSTSKRLNRLNGDCAHEIPLDAYSFGLAFNQGRVTASPVEPAITLEALNKPVMEENFKYSKDAADQENAVLKSTIPKARRNMIIPLIHTMHHALFTHAECGHSLKVLGNMERKLSKEFYLAKMRLREKFHILHSLLQLEELRGITLFENNYNKRKEEYAEIERSLCALRRQINETFKLEHGSLETLTKKRNLLKEAIAKPSRISWRHYEVTDEFNFEMDEYLANTIKNSLTLDTTERDSTISLEYVDPELSGKCEPVPLFRSPSSSSPHTTDNTTDHTTDDDTSPEKLRSIGVANSHRNIISGFDEEIVKLSKILSPELFYCTLWNNPEKIAEMNHHMESWCTNVFTHPPLPGTLKIGGFIFVFSELLHIWCRAKLLSINNDPEPSNSRKNKLACKNLVTSAYNQYTSRTVDAQLLDHGGVERVPYSRIRLPFEEVFNLERYPPLAIKCCLFGVKPRGDEWTDLAITAFRDFCGSRQLLMMVKATVGDLKKVDLYQHEHSRLAYNNASLREVLVYSRHARIQLNEADIIRFNTVDLDFRKPEFISIATTESVLVTEIQSPDLFYVTRFSNQQAFHDLHEKLKIYYELPDEPYVLYCPEKDQPCVALNDKTYYRALIKKVLDDDKVEVEFVDFGHTAIVENKNLRIIREEFLQKPIFAIACKLGDIAPIGGFKWSPESIEKFKDLIFGEPSGNSHIFNVSVLSYESNGKHVINLRRYTGSEYISINCALVSLKCAVSTGPLTENSSEEMAIPQLQVTKLDDRIFKVLEDFDVCGYKILRELVARNREAKSSKIDSFIKMRISHWIDPGKFHVQLTCPEVRSYFVCYENKLADEYTSRLDDPVPPIQDELNIKEPVIFVIREKCSCTWKRGIILSRTPPEDEENEQKSIKQDTPETIYKIYSRDFGFEMEIPRKYIWQLPIDSPYLKDGDFCLKCHLSDLAPAGGGSWTKSAIEIFSEYLEKYQDLYLYIQEKYLPIDPPDSVGIDVFGKEIYIESAVAPVKVKYHSFKTLLVNRGIAIPTRKMSLSDVEDNPESDDENTQKSKRSLIPTPKKDSVLSYIRSARANVRKQMSHVTIQFYKDPERPSAESFIGIPTEVHKGLKIWFRIHRPDGFQILNIINRTIDRALKDQEELLPFTGEPLNGRACTAFFEFDKTWNRAEILYAKDIENCYVRFVDYGNEACVTREQLSSQVFHPEVPKLALYGYLANCKPAINEKDDDSLVKMIGREIVDHQCVFYWENYQSLKDLKVSITLPNGSHLKKMLLDRNLVYEEASICEYVPAIMRNLIERLSMSGFKLPTMNFKKNVYYPVRITGNFRENCTFFQVKTINEPHDETDLAINAKIKDFLASLEALRSEIETFESCRDYKINDFVAAMFSDYKWYRAMVMETVSTIFGKEYRVLFVDLGFSAVVEKDKMKKIPYRYIQNTEIFAFPAKVVNIKPKNGVYSPLLSDKMGREVSKHEKDTLVSVENALPYDIEVFIADPENERTPKNSLWEPLFETQDLIKIEPVKSEIIEDTN